MASQVEWLSRRNAELEQERDKINRLANLLFELKEVDRRLRMLAGRQVGLQVAGGGREERTYAWDILEETSERGGFPPVFKMRVKEPEELVELLEKQRVILRATPSLWPVHGWVSAEFQEEPKLLNRQHLGIDIVAAYGSPVQAAADGIVTFAGWTDDLGYTVTIDHGFGFFTRYGHNSRLLVESGMRVKRGQVIAFLGSSGRSSGPHLHFEVWKDGQPVNPRDYLLR